MATTISAKTILRSKYKDTVLSTFLLRYPRFIHSEFMTHRILSKNSASSRAIPVHKLISDVKENMVIPLFWGVNEPGMQSFTYFPKEEWPILEAMWIAAANDAIKHATLLADKKVHKQIVNRILEPYAHITVLVSGTEWDNFIELRNHKDAEPHIQLLAKEILWELKTGPIQQLREGDWHLPFGEYGMDLLKEGRMISAARCASTSYKTVDGFDMNVERATGLYNKLIVAKPAHYSPLEHVAMAGEGTGNFKNFGQLRHLTQYQ